MLLQFLLWMLGLIQPDIVLWDKMYSDFVIRWQQKNPLAELIASFFDLRKIFILFLVYNEYLKSNLK